MAQQAEPMEVDCMDSDFDNKENSLHHNVLCTEKGYEELDVSELNMKLRYSMTPASSPMSKSYTACPDNRYLETEDSLPYCGDNANLTRSLNSTMTKNDNVIKSLKSLPLQTRHTDQFGDGNGNQSVLRQLESSEAANVTITLNRTNDIDENVSLPSSSSSVLNTPEATTPTKEMKDGGSPIMRGLKSVLNMFRSSTSPVPPIDNNNTTDYSNTTNNTTKQEGLSAADSTNSDNAKSCAFNPIAVSSTPVAAHRHKEGSTSKRSSPYKDSIVFNDDLEKELNWKDEKLSSSPEKNPIHKLLLQNSKTCQENKTIEDLNNSNMENHYHSVVEYMDVSNNESIMQDKTMTELHPNDNHDNSVAVESDSEFVDCETSLSKNESYILNIKSIQEKILSIPSPEETNNVSITTKNNDFLDCDSTFSRNESYVLDIKEIQEKIFAKPNFNETIEPQTDNMPSVNKIMDQNVTSMSFADLDLKHDTTIPSDLADYSQATANILNELEKLEGASKNETDENKIVHDNFKNEDDVPEVLATTVNLNELSLKHNEITGSEDNCVNITENNCSDLEITLTENQNPDVIKFTTSTIDNALNSATNTEQCSENSIGSENNNLSTHEGPVNNALGVKEENLHNINEVQALDATTVQDSNKIEFEDVADIEITSQESINTNNIGETPSSETPSDIQDDCVSTVVVNTSVKDDSSSEILCVKLNDFVPETEILAVDTVSEHVKIPHDLSSAIEVVESLKTLDLPQNVSSPATEIQKSENPSDIPLPDDDGDKKAVVCEVSTISTEMAHVYNSETIITLSETESIDNIAKNVVDSLVENSNGTNVPPQPLEIQISDPLISENTDTESFDVKASNNNEVMLPEINNLSLKNDVSIPLQQPTSISNDLKLAANDNIDEQTPDILPENKITESNAVNETDSPSSITINQTNDNIAGEKTEIINESHVTNDLNLKTETSEILVQNKSTSEVEPMDMTLDESLNLTHELPDLVNQTIVLADENVKNSETANNIIFEPKQLDLSSKLAVVENIDNVTNSKSISDTIECVSDIETKNMEKKSVNDNSVINETNNLNDEKQVTIEMGEEKSENVIMNLSDEQPPRIFTNIPDSEAMEVEKEAVDEEVIVSANNSPYVSLMSGIETVPEKNEESDKLEDAFEEIENPFIAKNNIASSPPITSKGYNFNFDEIDDPFATKTNIRLSPPLDTPTKPAETESEKDKQFKAPPKGIVNRRKSQPPERKRPNALKKKFNNSFDAKTPPTTSAHKIDKTIIIENIEKDSKASEISEYTQVLNEVKTTIAITEENIEEKSEKQKTEDQNNAKAENLSTTPLQKSEENKSIESIHVVSSDLKTTSSSEQSAYYSAGASSTESIKSKNVFNLPEIDDVNFNPFATKSKMRQSPPPFKEMDNPFATRSKIRSSPDVSIISDSQLDKNRTITLDEAKLAQLSKNIEHEDKMETELMEKDSSVNTTDSTTSSRVTDNQNITTREVNTEDEDTIEGPFLNADDDMDKDILDVATDDADDMIQFNDAQETVQEAEDNLDGELFIDAEAYEFLLNQNMNNVVADSGKESLFLKFDPLFAQRISSDSVLAALNKAQKKQSTPTKPIRPSLRNEASPIAGPSTLNATYDGENNVSQESNDDANITVAKPMMVVTPALNPVVTPRNKYVTPARSNRHSITFTSPAIAVIDRLLSMSANNSLLGHDTTFTSLQSNTEQNEADVALTQLRELLAEKEISVHNLRSETKELKDRLSGMESQVRILETEGRERLKKINDMTERLAEKTKTNKDMAAVFEEYERTIASLIADMEQDKKRNAEEKIRLIKERDEQTAHLASMEVSFSDLHSKYEKSKQIILTCKANEDLLKKTIQDFQEQVTKMQTNYEMLKQHATAKLNHANQELEKINRAHETEVVKLNAMIKRNQLLATSLQETLVQKTKANDELTAICDELINKVGSNK